MSAPVVTTSSQPSLPREPRPGLAPVKPANRRPAPKAPFVVTVLLLLLSGLGGLLMLNTLLAQGAFTVHDLDLRVAALKDQEQALQQKVATLAAPGRLAHRAHDIGMVPAPNPAFIRMSDGQILGEPKVAPQQYTVPVAPPPVPAQNDRGQSAGQPQQGQQGQQQSQQGQQQSQQGQQQSQQGQQQSQQGQQQSQQGQQQDDSSGAGREKND